MEPVPETERMEEFRSSPLPALRLQHPAPIITNDSDPNRKPPYVRRSTEPSSPSSPSWLNAAISLPYRPRTTSPLSGTHTRSKSAASSLTVPSMGRTRSMPGVDGTGRLIYPPLFRPASPARSPSRTRTPRKPADEAFPPDSPIRTSVLDADKKPVERSSSPILGMSASSTTSPRYTSFYQANVSTSSLPVTPSSVTSSPSSRPEGISIGYNFSNYHPSSSVPSTPSSIRSRSPSISSLETIPDTPDAEEAALEAERMAQLKAAAEAAEGGGDAAESKGRSSMDPSLRGRVVGLGSRDKRKRWSVCGAEGRGDLDLETIWED